MYSSGTLTGNGTFSTTNGTTTIEGTLSPSGTLTISGNISFGTFGTMQSNVVPSSADNVHVTAGASLDGRLSVTMTGTFTPGARYILLTADGGLNQTRFSSVSIKFPTGQGFSPQINYDTNHVYLDLLANQGP